MSKYLFIIIIGLTLLSCNNSPRENSSPTKVSLTEKLNYIPKDTLYSLLENSIRLDSFSFKDNNHDYYLYIKSGNFLSPKIKNAIIFYCIPDSYYSYNVELYSENKGKWIKKDTKVFVESFPIQFDLTFDDFDFDGSKDIYLQILIDKMKLRSYSQGYLLLINPITQGIELHTESRYLINILPDYNSRTIFSEEIKYYKSGLKDSCRLENKWMNGKLKTINKECVSK